MAGGHRSCGRRVAFPHLLAQHIRSPYLCHDHLPSH